MEIRKAELKDLDALFDNRMEFIRNMHHEEVVISDEFKKNTYEFMKQHMADASLAVWVATDNQRIVSCAMVSYYQTLPVMPNPSGNTGYILNVYTHPDYRLRGLATELLKRLIQDSKEKNVGKLHLNATDMGKPVYEKLGFEQLTRDMAYNLG
jgi:predicted GNAT family acetyltransferase